MTVWEAIILGITQGLTEFLPVSSSGHLILMGRFLGTADVSVGFELVCHLGTLLAVIIAMRREVWAVVCKPIGKQMRLIIVASIPTAVIGGIITCFFRDALEGAVLIYGFIITGILLVCCGIFGKDRNRGEMLYPHAAAIGTAQGIAVLPGLSRSGATIAAATMLGYNREQAAKFSFLLSIPVIAGSSIIELALNGVGSGVGAIALIAALVSSFVSGFVAVAFMLKLLKNHGTEGFAVYLMLLSVFLLVNECVLHLF